MWPSKQHLSVNAFQFSWTVIWFVLSYWCIRDHYFFMLSFFILLLIFVYGYFYELDKIRELSSKIPFIIQFFYICEGDLIIFSVFLILFKFVFTKNSAFKVFLQKQLWVPISRSFYPIMFFVSPFASIILYDFNYSLSLGFTKLIFLFTLISAKDSESSALTWKPREAATMAYDEDWMKNIS
jgi:hypothetical protein